MNFTISVSIHIKYTFYMMEWGICGVSYEYTYKEVPIFLSGRKQYIILPQKPLAYWLVWAGGH